MASDFGVGGGCGGGVELEEPPPPQAARTRRNAPTRTGPRQNRRADEGKRSWGRRPTCLIGIVRNAWRRGSESNRRIKVLQTSPLPLGYRAFTDYLSVPARKCPLDERSGRGRFWSGRRDLNPRLRPWQGRTLPLSYSRSTKIILQYGRGGRQCAGVVQIHARSLVPRLRRPG